jgi:oxygen-dependent protoporphyrinogen oxidase
LDRRSWIGGYIEKVVVIGGGISGLACAYRLKQLGIHSVVLEAEWRAGGLIATVRKDGFLFETGPQCPRFPPAVWKLMRELKLENEFLAGDRRAKRFIFRNGRLHGAPFSPAGLLTTSLIGPVSKFRILTEGFRSSRGPAHEESLADFVLRKFGPDVLHNLVDPIVSTVFFGDPEKMGMESAFPVLAEWERDHGSLVRAAIRARKRAAARPAAPPADRGNRDTLRVTDGLPTLGSFRLGMEALPAALSKELDGQIRYGASAVSMSFSALESGENNSLWRIDLSNGTAVRANCVVLAVPAYGAAQLLRNAAPQLAAHLLSIEYAPACVVSSAYARSQVAHPLDGFGFMVPRQEGLHITSTFWNSSMFAERAPEGKMLITSFAADARGDDFMSMPEEECAYVVEGENARILGITGKPLDRLVWRAAQALPQYNVGHKEGIAHFYRDLCDVRNLFVVGNYLTGRSIGDCTEIAFRVADEVYSRLQFENISINQEMPQRSAGN